VVSTLALRRVELFSLLFLFLLIRSLDWVLRVALNAVSAEGMRGMKQDGYDLTRLEVLKGCLCLYRDDRCASASVKRVGDTSGELKDTSGKRF